MLRKTLLAALVVAVPVSFASAQTYTPDVNDASAWTVVKDDDSMIDFGWDYSAFGIPAAPGGSDTTGIRMAANIVGPNPAMISASPTDLSLTAPYTMSFDFWINYNSSGGTTEFAGGHIGFNQTMGNPFNGVGVIGDSDGDSGRDIRLYIDDTEQTLADDPNYLSIASQNNSDEPLTSAFTGGTTPDAQTMAPFDPTNVQVTAPNGSLGYAWRKMDIDVGTDEAIFKIDDLEIARVPSSVGLDGNVALTFGDLFSSVSTKPEFSFGVFDNLVISQVPEPSVIGLIAMALTGLAIMRRSDAS